MSEELPTDSQGKIIVFGAKQIRRAWHENQWYFSVVDIVEALTDSPNPRNYWNMMKAREKEGSGIELSTLCVQLKLTSADGKSYKTDTVSTENAFRVIQSIPSAKAEPFKRWLAEVGYQRVQEIENPELAQQRMRELYKAKTSSRTRRPPGKEARWPEMRGGNWNPNPAGRSARGRITCTASPRPNCRCSRRRSDGEIWVRILDTDVFAGRACGLCRSDIKTVVMSYDGASIWLSFINSSGWILHRLPGATTAIFSIMACRVTSNARMD